MRRAKTAFLVLAAAGLCGPALLAPLAEAAPATAVEIAIQGVARDASDVPIPSGDVLVRVYADSLGGGALWSSGMQFQGAIVQGLFDVIVGRAVPLLLDHELPYFLELDVAGTEVIGDAAGGRERFYAGGGAHGRNDLEARIAALETAMGISARTPVGGDRSALARTASANPAPRLASGFTAQHGFLGLAAVAGTSAGGLGANGSLFVQPVGIRSAGAVQAWLGPLFLSTPPPNPLIRSIADVPNDQGRSVRLRWRGDRRERAYVGSDPLPRITSYTVYRRVEPGQAPMSSVRPSEEELTALPPGTWDVLTSVPATLDSVYQTVVPTLCDSNAAGVCRSVLLVRSITDQVGTYHNSAADSGYSVDNLAPGVPAGLVTSTTSSGTQLSWQSSTAPDFQYFRVYRSTDPDFVPGSASLVHATAGTGWLDPQLGSYTYKLTAVDANGNESPPAVATTVTGVGEEGAPRSLAFAAFAPNPFRHQLSLAIDVPERSGHVSLAVFDVTGRRVRTLVDGALAPGRYAFRWDGRADGGASLAPGVYVARLTGAGRTLTRRATLLP